jgi:hypothetical protein
LGLAEQNPQGVLMIGAHLFARRLAEQLVRHGIRVVLIDSNYRHVTNGRLEGLDVVYGNALSEETIDRLDFGGIGRMLALTGNDEVNALLVLQFPEFFGRSEVYQLPSSDGIAHIAPVHMRGRFLFGRGITYEFLNEQLEEGATMRATALTHSFTYQDYLKTHDVPIPLGLITRDNRLNFFTVDNQPTPRPGHIIVSLIPVGDGNAKS